MVSPQTKLTKAQVFEARELLRTNIDITVGDLSKRYGIPYATFSRNFKAFFPEPIMRHCAACNDSFEMKGKTRYCDDECRKKSMMDARKLVADRPKARTRAMTKLASNHPEEFERLLEAELGC